MTSLWRRTTSERQTLGEVPGLAAKKLRNTLSGTFLAKLGSKGKDPSQGSNDFSIKAFPGPEKRTQPSASPEPSTDSGVKSWLAASAGPQVPASSPEQGAAAADKGEMAGSPWPSHQSANMELEPVNASSKSYTEELVQFLGSNQAEKADTLLKLRSLKQKELDTNRKLERGVSYADEALDSMTVSLNLERDADKQVKEAEAKQVAGAGPAVPAAAMSNSSATATAANLQQPPDNNSFSMEPGVSTGAPARSTRPPDLDDADAESDDALLIFSEGDDKGMAGASGHTLEDAERTLLTTKPSPQRLRQVKRGESYADEVLGNLTSEVSSASDDRSFNLGNQDSSSRSIAGPGSAVIPPADDYSASTSKQTGPISQTGKSFADNFAILSSEESHAATEAKGWSADADRRLESKLRPARVSESGNNSQPARLQADLSSSSGVQKPRTVRRGESYADEVAYALTSEASDAATESQVQVLDAAAQLQGSGKPARVSQNGDSSQLGKFQAGLSKSSSMQQPRAVRRGESYADEVMSMLSSELSQGSADALPGADATDSTQAPLPSASMGPAASESEPLAIQTDSLAEPAAADPQELQSGYPENKDVEPAKLSSSRSPSRQPSSKVLRRGESYADEVLESILAEDESSTSEEIMSRPNWAGLPTIMEGEQVVAQSPSQAQAMRAAADDSWRDSGRPASRHGSEELQHDSPAAEVPESQPSLFEDGQAPYPERKVLADLPQSLSRRPSVAEAPWPGEGRPASLDQLPAGKKQESDSNLPDEPNAAIANDVISGARPASEGGTYAEILSLSQDDGIPDSKVSVQHAMRDELLEGEASAQGQGTSELPKEDAQWGSELPVPGAAEQTPAADGSLSSSVPAEAFVEPSSVGRASDLGSIAPSDDPPQAREEVQEDSNSLSQPGDDQSEGQSNILPGIADAADKQARVLHARLSRSLSATGKAAKILHKTAAYVRRTASITRSIPILPSQQSQRQQQDNQLAASTAASPDTFIMQEALAERLTTSAAQADASSSPGNSQEPDRNNDQQGSRDLRGDEFDRSAQDGLVSDKQNGMDPPAAFNFGMPHSSSDRGRMQPSRLEESGKADGGQAAQFPSTPPAYIDDDASPALQSPAVNSPSPPQLLQQSVSTLPPDVRFNSGMHHAREQEHQRQSNAMRATHEAAEDPSSCRPGAQHTGTSLSPGPLNELKRLSVSQAARHNAASQTQVATDPWIPRRRALKLRAATPCTIIANCFVTT